MIFHSWSYANHNLESKYIRPMKVVELSRYSSPEDSGKAAAGLGVIAKTDVLMLRHFGEAQVSNMPALGSESLAEFLGGPCASETSWKNYMTRFWATYAKNGGRQPKMVVIDHEGGYTWYRIGADPQTCIQNIKSAISKPGFPKTLKESFDPVVLSNVNNSKSPGADWVASFSAAMISLFGKVLYNTLRSGYVEAGFSGNVFSNYDMAKTSGPIIDINGWISPTSTNAGGFGRNSLPIYPNVSGSRGIPASTYANLINSGSISEAKNRLISGSKVGFRNALASMIAMKPIRVPWFAKPRYRGDGIPGFNTLEPAKALISAAKILGVSDVLYWASPSETPQERAELESILQEVNNNYKSGLILNMDPTASFPEYANAIDLSNIDFS